MGVRGKELVTSVDGHAFALRPQHVPYYDRGFDRDLMYQ
jgi:hypothetical protein